MAEQKRSLGSPGYKVSIRAGHSRHDAEISELERAYFPLEALSSTQVAYYRGRAQAFVLVAESEDSSLVGYIIGALIQRRARAVVWVITIAVVESRRGQGIGKSLLEAAIQAARGLGARSAMLHVDVTNDRAIGLYEGLGFRAVGHIPAYYGSGNDALAMRKNLRRPVNLS